MFTLKELYTIDIDQLLEIESALLKFSECDKNDIRQIWSDHSEALEDSYMSDHMANRFEKAGLSDPAIFFVSCDPANQMILTETYSLRSEKIYALMMFFQYIKCSLGTYHIKQILGNDNYIVISWTRSTSIDFFFGLSADQQTKLVNHYNETYD